MSLLDCFEVTKTIGHALVQSLIIFISINRIKKFFDKNIE